MMVPTHGGGASGPNRDDESPHDVSLSVDAIFDVLGSSERRLLLEYLVDADGQPLSVDDIVSYLVDWHTLTTGEIPSQNNIEIRLSHTHLPKLVDMGIIDYDLRSRALHYYGNKRLEAWLQRAREEAPE